MSGYQKVLTLETVNPVIKTVEYAVRGKLVLRALELEKQLAQAREKHERSPLPFDEIIYCNIGNPQQLNQHPMTFIRQVLACVEYPELMQHAELFPADVIARAHKYIAATGCVGATGAYSHSKGLAVVRNEVADFIERRDGAAAGRPDPETVFLSHGASVSVKTVLNFLIAGKNTGIMTPIPQYPLYSATIAALSGTLVSYYLDEEHGWALNIPELERSYGEARKRGIDLRALVVINPNNPTGTTLTRANMEEIITFCHDKRLVLLADEVYQENIYSDVPFLSFRKVMKEMGGDVAKDLELISFHSVSKGFLGECGKRGGYMQMENIREEIIALFYKMVSVNLCPNLVGQLVTGMMVNPPKAGEPSHELYARERAAIIDGLRARSAKLAEALNRLEGFVCSKPSGAMYLFPRVTIPRKAIEAARARNETPDTFYAMELLQAAGICVVPGSGFGQREGTAHFRTTFLPPAEKMDKFIDSIAKFNEAFMDKYRDGDAPEAKRQRV